MWSAVAADPRQKEAAPANGLAGAGHRRRKTGPRYVVDVDQRHRPVTRRPQVLPSSESKNYTAEYPPHRLLEASVKKKRMH